jgi:peptide/nickel transport system substrate-binding protein
LLSAGRSTFDTAKRKQVYAKLEALLSAQLPIELIYQRNEIDAFATPLKGISGSIDSVFWNVARWHF